MKLSELRPCAKCGGKIAPIFYRVTIEGYVIDPSSANQVLALNQMFGGNALHIAETMAPNADGAAMLLQSKSGLICADCFISRPGSALHIIFESKEDNPHEATE